MSALVLWPGALSTAHRKNAGCICGRKGRKVKRTQRTQREHEQSTVDQLLRCESDAGNHLDRFPLRPLRPFASFASNALQHLSARAVLGCAILGLTGAAPAAPVDYRFDPVHSHLQFGADHMGFSTSIGRFTRWQGEFTYDPENPGANRVDVTIHISSLDLGDGTWNQTMLGRKWLDAERFPQARFVGSRFEPIDTGRALLHGVLTLKGIAHPLTLEVRINRIGTHPYTLKATAGFSASATLSRAAFGLDALPGTLADAVDIRIEVEGQRAKPLPRKPGKR
jgi:polyisoprenoid-binding protein YceI